MGALERLISVRREAEAEALSLMDALGQRAFARVGGFSMVSVWAWRKHGLGRCSMRDIERLAGACERARGVLADMEREAERLGNCEESAEGG